MRITSIIIILLGTTALFAQAPKNNSYTRLQNIDGTPMVASIMRTNIDGVFRNNSIMFLNTGTGISNQLDLPTDVDIVELFTNNEGHSNGEKFVLIQSNLLSDKKASYMINHQSLFICDSNGKGMKRLTNEDVFLVDWLVNTHTNTLVINTRMDSNFNGKMDNEDPSHIKVVDLNTMEILYTR